MNPIFPLQEVQSDMEQGRLREAAQKCREHLRHDPGNTTAIGIYGDLAIAMRQPDNAIVIFQKLLKVEPRHAAAHSRLADLFNVQGDLVSADAHARSALSIDPGRAEPHVVLGSILLSKQRESEALEEFETARSLAPGSFYVESAYIDALLTSGQFEQARESLRELIARHPEEAFYYAQLAKSHKFSEGDADEGLIRSLLDEQGNLPKALRGLPDRSVSAYTALFKLESDLENYDKAFHYLSLAKKIRQAENPNVTDFAEGFKTIREVFDAQFMRSRDAVGCMGNDPIFVVGMPRSGTTLLERVLAGHPNVAAAGELPHVQRLGQEACAHVGSSQFDLSALRKLPDPVWRELGEEYIRRARRLGFSEEQFVDKMPGNFLSLGFIKTMLPRARIVHISRHPVATCLSIYEQDFSVRHEYAEDLHTLGSYYLQYLEHMDHWRSLFGEDIIEIDYEVLVADESAAYQWLTEQLGLADDSHDLEGSQSTGAIRSASLWQARQPVHTASVARWQNYREQLRPLLDTLTPVLGSSIAD